MPPTEIGCTHNISSGQLGKRIEELLLEKLRVQQRVDSVVRDELSYKEEFYDDSANSYKYIVFVLVIYAVSFLALMVKYFWNAREGRHFDGLYDEFVTRDSFKVIKLPRQLPRSSVTPNCVFVISRSPKCSRTTSGPGV